MFFLIGQNISNNQLIPILALFAAAGFRLMPSVNRFVNNFQQLRSLTPIVNLLYKDFLQINSQSNELESSANFSFKKNISLNKIEYQYEKTNDPVLSNLKLNIQHGMKIGLVGKSGSGKTTIVDVITGLLLPTEGNIEVDGQKINRQN